MNYVMKLNNICKSYTKGSCKVNALNNVCLTVKKGDYTAIIGASGSGKSTMMNIIGCLDKADSGEYYLNGKNVSKMNEKSLDRIRSNEIGFVFQKFYLIPSLNAIENVMMPLIYKGINQSTRYELAKNALIKVGLADRLTHFPNELSGGQQQRVAIARAIVTNPKVILADEPTGNLDSKSGNVIINLLKELNENGKTILLITHDDKTASSAKKQVVLKDGKIIE